jgi:hypothetical protein
MSESEYQESLGRIATAARARLNAEVEMERAKDIYQDAKRAYKDACKHERDVIEDAMTELPLFDRGGSDAPGNAQEAQGEAFGLAAR